MPIELAVSSFSPSAAQYTRDNQNDVSRRVLAAQRGAFLLEGTSFHRHALRMSSCGQHPQRFLCDYSFCVHCGGGRWSSFTKPLLHRLKTMRIAPDAWTQFITVNHPDVRAEHLPDALRSLQDGFKGTLKTPAFKHHVLGSLRSLEVSISPDGRMYHPHTHLVLIADTEDASTEMLMQFSKRFQSASGIPGQLDALCSELVPTSERATTQTLIGYSCKLPKIEVAEMLVQDQATYLGYVQAVSGRRMVSLTGSMSQTGYVEMTPAEYRAQSAVPKIWVN